MNQSTVSVSYICPHGRCLERFISWVRVCAQPRGLRLKSSHQLYEFDISRIRSASISSIKKLPNFHPTYIQATVNMADIIEQMRRRYLESMDWSPAFKSGITAIEALGRCLIVTSHPSAALIKLGEESGYVRERLPVLLHDCAVMGMDTFMDTQMRMSTIVREATELMEPSGPVISLPHFSI